MKIKRSLLAALAMSSIAGVAYADAQPADSPLTLQSGDYSVSLYGVLDAAIANDNHSYGISPLLPNQIYPFQAQPINPSNGSVTGLISGGLSDSRWGVKGAAVLMNSQTKAIFDLESGFDVISGQLNNAAGAIAANPKITNAAGQLIQQSVNTDSSLNGQLFNRQAWVGLSDQNLGALTLGRQNNPMKDVFAAYDPVKSDTFSPFGESGAYGGGGGISESARMDDSIKYENTFGNSLKLAVVYQFGNSAGTGTNGTTGYALRVGYENDTFGVQAVYNNFTDALLATSSTTPGDIALNPYDTDAYLLAGKYKPMQDLTLNAGYEKFTRKSPSDVMNIQSIWGYTVSSSTPAAGFTTSGQSQAYDIYYLGGDYNLAPKWNLSAGYYHDAIGQLSDVANKDGTIQTVSAVLDYKMLKMVDVYAALTTNNFSGNAFPSASFNTSVQAYGVGARLKF
ncbi:MAG: porin [Gallionellaceae bacterium]